jgi:hypothetical protein
MPPDSGNDSGADTWDSDKMALRGIQKTVENGIVSF